MASPHQTLWRSFMIAPRGKKLDGVELTVQSGGLLCLHNIKGGTMARLHQSLQELKRKADSSPIIKAESAADSCNQRYNQMASRFVYHFNIIMQTLMNRTYSLFTAFLKSEKNVYITSCLKLAGNDSL